jgi:hypothetical protein
MKNLKTKILTAILTVAPALALAAVKGPQQVKITSYDQILRVLDNIINIIGTLFFTVAVVFIFYAAYLYLTAAGDPEKLTKAKNQLIYSIVAIAIGLIAFSVTTIVSRFISG